VRTTGEPVFDSDGHIVAVHGGFQDISAQKSAEEDAEALSERLQKTLESITDGFFTLDRAWRFTYLNQEAARLLQRPREELLGQDFWDCLPEAIGTRLERAYRQAMIAQETAIFEEYYRPFGTWFDVRAYPSADGLAVYLQDVTDRHRMVRSLQSQKAALRRSRDQLAELVQTRKALIDSLPAHIALLDDQGVIVDVNNQWRRFGEQNGLGDERSGVGSNYIAICEAASGACAVEAPAIACGLRDVLAGERQTFVLEYPCHSPTEQRWFRVAANRLRPSNDAPVNARGEGAVVMHVDITERKLAELELDALVNRDRLTNLLTRNGFTKALGERLKRIDGSPRAVLAMFDIKDLRDINDSHGFQAGDQLLIEIARWLEQHAGDQGLVGRIAGDEFSVLLPLTPGADPHARIEALQRISQHVFLNPDSGIEIALDIGYTVVGDSPPSAEELLHQAELALFQHPPHGTAPPIAYNTELDTQVHERLELSRDLRAALDDHQFELHFQPKVQLTDGSLVACEALLRWNHPQRGLQPPGVFIPIAEQSQLIGPLGEWALHEACRRLREWQAAGLNVVGLAVNVSLIQFRIADFSHAVRAALDAHEVDPGALTLEITESVFADASDALLEELNALRAVGVRLSLDDFGTGYSSLAYLQRYPFDEIKVDRCFVARVREDRYSRTVLQAVKGIADALGANLIAEGIETEAVRQALIELGFEHGQGYLFSMPLETEDFRWLLEQGCQLPLGPDMP
jgi:diguanylate cyclase (GGDEF)-like protein/PAS domain S-box-containing protein